MLVRVVAPHFVAGMIVEDGYVVRAAPILSWALGRTLDGIESYAQRKGWTVERL